MLEYRILRIREQQPVDGFRIGIDDINSRTCVGKTRTLADVREHRFTSLPSHEIFHELEGCSFGHTGFITRELEVLQECQLGDWVFTSEEQHCHDMLEQPCRPEQPLGDFLFVAVVSVPQPVRALGQGFHEALIKPPNFFETVVR